MKLLILATDYPDLSGNVASMFIHTRNKYYLRQGFDVTVLNFKPITSYEIDGIKVISLADYQTQPCDYDLLIGHAPNLRNHYRFLRKFGHKFPKIVLFFHGHEVLKISDVYPPAYPFKKERPVWFQNCYDWVKVKLWANYFRKNQSKLELIFVSQWLFDKFCYYVGLNQELAKKLGHIIHNSVAREFEINSQASDTTKKYDFISIRGNLDDAKYGVDIVNQLAHSYPQYKFCLVGRGKFFDYYDQAPNLHWINSTLSHKDMLDLLNESRFGLMPTREDTQGVMSCEILTYGLPLISSDIAVCQEILGEFPNVRLVSNNLEEIDLEEIVHSFEHLAPSPKPDRYFEANTIAKEVELFKNIINFDKDTRRTPSHEI